MVRKYGWRVALLACFMMPALVSCIKPEAPNAEADIEKCILGQDMLFKEIVITNETVEITVNSWVDVTKLSPVFIITEGATIAPENGSTRDFSNPQSYVVTSQDGKWNKAYTVVVKKPSMVEQPVWHYSFEGVTDQPYLTIQELDKEGHVTMSWASGNWGALFQAKQWYTTQDPNGYKGNGVKMETKAVPLGILMGKPIAAGSIFMGEVNTNEMLGSDPTKATHFGIPFMQEPHSLEGYYKYQPGPKMTDKKNKKLPGEVDNFSIYAIFYESTQETPWLDGSNALTHEQLVSVAQLKNKKVSDKWVHFSIPFVTKEGKSIDPIKLKAGRYRIAIVASSSERGGEFIGAVGSTLWIDEFSIYCK